MAERDKSPRERDQLPTERDKQPLEHDKPPAQRDKTINITKNSVLNRFSLLFMIIYMRGDHD